ncbi:MAG: AzlC family ABC transporter permease [Eubacterium sp.]|nr:AzlC family ABC transporter permease [Eubacterium sp.]
MTNKEHFKKGIWSGVPIALGYLSVSFGVGILATKAGMNVFQATMLSLTNLTSAGEAAGIGIIAAHGTLAEMALSQLIINLRYALMSMSLSQKLAPSFTTPHRLLVSYGITDEIFAVSSAVEGRLYPAYMYGMILIATAGWVAGTCLGAAAGQLLPANVSEALGIMLYGMFIAIIIPAARDHLNVLFVIAAAVALSCFFFYCVPQITSGFSVILCAVIASCAAAILFPVDDEGKDEAENKLRGGEE